MLLLSALFFCEGYTDDTLYGAGEEDEVCGGGDIECGWGGIVDDLFFVKGATGDEE